MRGAGRGGFRGAALVLGAALLLTLGACGKKPEAAGGKTPQELRVGVMYSSDIIPLAVMRAKEMDVSHGVRVDMQVFSSAKDRDAALSANELDGVFTDFVGMCIYRNAGLDMKITGVTDGDYLLLAGAGTGITSLKDAAGKNIAISENTLIEYALDYLLEQDGRQTDYLVKEVVPRIPDRLEMLRASEVSLCLLPEPFATLAKSDGAALLGSANASGLYPAVCAFTQSSLEEKGDAVSRMYEAWNEAVQYVNETPVAEFEDIIIKDAGFPEELAGKIELPTFRGAMLPTEEELRRAIDWAAAKGLCGSGLTPASLCWSVE